MRGFGPFSLPKYAKFKALLGTSISMGSVILKEAGVLGLGVLYCLLKSRRHYYRGVRGTFGCLAAAAFPRAGGLYCRLLLMNEENLEDALEDVERWAVRLGAQPLPLGASKLPLTMLVDAGVVKRKEKKSA